MRHLFCLCFSIFCINTPSLTGQVSLVREEVQTLQAKLSLIDNEIKLIESSTQENILIESLSLQFKNGAIYIPYQFSKIARDEFYQIQVQLSFDKQLLQPYREDIIGLEELGKQSQILDGTIIFKNISSYLSKTRGNLNLNFKVGLYKKLIDCEAVPTFSVRQQLPFYSAGGVGLVLVGTGAYLINSGQKIYEEDYLQQISESAAEPFFNKANNRRKTGITLSYIGAAILTSDLVWWFIRKKRYQKAKKRYDANCLNTSHLQLKPALQWAPNQETQIGLGLHLTF